MLVVRKHSTKPFNGTRVEKVWETLLYAMQRAYQWWTLPVMLGYQQSDPIYNER